MAKYKEIFGVAKEKIPCNFHIFDLATEICANASVKISTTDKNVNTADNKQQNK